MSWLRKALVHLALSRSNEALVKASGGEPRTVRGMTLDPRFQFLEAQARARALPWERMTVDILRAQTDAGSDLFGGKPVGGVRIEKQYVTGRSHSVPTRLYLPTVRDNSAAMLVYFHFGGGVVGSLETAHRFCSMLAKEAGAPVMSVEYRLAPEYKFPVGLEDCIAAYQWAVDNAARFGAPVGKAAVGGDSMGGHFAAIIAQEFRKTKPPVLQLLIYPAVDFTSETPSMHDFADAWPLTAETVDFFMKQYLPGAVDPGDPRISPLRTEDLRGLAPALVYTAGFDMLLDQGKQYADRLQEAGVKTSYHCFESLPHGFIAFPTASPAAEAALRRIAGETAAALKGTH
ncbi:MAG TPA: alpha/beta hydrolase [Vitreimonas sp.]|uniref:alpha/beta hydrolase n=1 Tax=Vitreimonas sp. TaxID=3069702 RepID=UPI002D74F2A2|nr:alpha/beta hydrolase [Vitreimonas sp.]HYD86647.1 alpha/beta hydrolase [Vitreimonas sp.]